MKIPIAADGWRFILGFGAVGAFLVWLGAWWSLPWGVLLILLAAFSLFFFRDFNRPTALNPDLIYSPADGKVMEVSSRPSGELFIRIFLSVFDGHMQRAPAQGRVSKVKYTKGLFLDARDPEAHVRNEQNEIVIETPRGPIVVTQIAGLIARRIVCWIKDGGTLEQGQRYGLIRFGSQVDVLMPASANVLVKKGDRVFGGESVLARWPS